MDDVSRVQSLLRFAGKVLTARERVLMQMGDTRLGVFRQRDIYDLPGVLMDGDDGEWLIIKRLEETSPKSPDEEVAEFLENDGSNPFKVPELKPVISKVVSVEDAEELQELNRLKPEHISETFEKGELLDDFVRVSLFIEDHAEIQEKYEEWISRTWKIWSDQEKLVRKSLDLYNSLFKIHSSIHVSEGVPPEVIWGFGIGIWSTQDKKIEMPIIEQEVEIEIVSEGDLLIRPRNKPMELSLKPYLELEVPNSANLQSKLVELLEKTKKQDEDISPLSFTAIKPILQTAASELDSGGKYISNDDLIAENLESDDKLKILETWAMYVRPRSATARYKDLEELAKVVDKEQRSPIALKGFVLPEPDQENNVNTFGLDPTILGNTGATNYTDDPEVYNQGFSQPQNSTKKNKNAYFFPLPFNSEQAKIIDTLEGRNGSKYSSVVSVTGPPGTGKSHTIANLVAHSMACGKRVLVTARTAEAISVVREKLPTELQSLVIASTGTDRESTELLKNAVSELSDTISRSDFNEVSSERDDLEAKILECDKAIEEAENAISSIARANLEQITLHGKEFTPMDLVTALGEGEVDHSWFLDRPKVLPRESLNNELLVLKEKLPDIAPDLELRNIILPAIQDIPSAADILEAHNIELSRGEHVELDPSNFAPMAINEPDDLKRAQLLLNQADKASQDLSTFTKNQSALLRFSTGDAASLEVLVKLFDYISSMNLDPDIDNVRYGRDVSFNDLYRAVERGAAGQKPAPGLFNGKLKAAVKDVSINGNIVSEKKDWRTVLGAMNLERKSIEIIDGLEMLPIDTSWINDQTGGWVWAKKLRSMSTDLSLIAKIKKELGLISERAKYLFPQGLNLDEIRSGDTSKLIMSLQANTPSNNITHRAKLSLSNIGELSSHSFFSRIKELAKAIGHADIETNDLVRERSSLTIELQRLHNLKDELAIVQNAFTELENSGGAKWSKMLQENPENAVDLIPENWIKSWEWAVITGSLEAVVSLGNGDQHRIKKAQAIKDRAKHMISLIQVRTMLGLKSRMTSSVQRAMQAFTQAVSRIGKGTGKSAPRYRTAAQNAAREVAVAAPVWIMPEYRIAEQIPSEIESFDLVILDEASQSDVTAIAALARGKQVLVVGDEEQVSPSNVGIPQQKINALRAEYLAHIPNADLIDENTSIFEITMRMHPESNIILREHFRSVAPIINFSAQFYNNRLIPLRVALPSERFDPPLVDVFIEEAHRKGKTNVTEAKFIVDEIAKIISEPEHDTRDIGVVSLIGSEQARLIETLLLSDERVGSLKIHERKIICGDARTMQGQERSIMFLSMVVTPDTVRSQSTREVQQRFNVAMSRARDRVYLVRSVETRNLKKSDAKLKILKHFEDPMPEGSNLINKDLFDLCDSGFEREVLGRLLDAGYRAIPQVSAGAFKIDIVVEGLNDRRLAIELDGDAYHGPERWAQDMSRQAALERAGWVFWRVFGSQWSSEKERFWDDLISTLSTMNIDPIGSNAENGSFVELRLIGKIAETKVEDKSNDLSNANLSEDKPTPVKANKILEPMNVFNEVNESEEDTIEYPAENFFQQEKIGEQEIEANCTVSLERDDGEIMNVFLVEKNADTNNGEILTSSPLGEALMGGLSGEEVEYTIGKNDMLKSVRILDVTARA